MRAPYKYLIAAALGLVGAVAAHAQLQITGINAFFSNVVPAGSATVTNNGYNTVNTFTSPPTPGQSVVITSTPMAVPLAITLGSPSFVQVDTFTIDKQNVSGSGISSSYNFNLQFEFNGSSTTNLALLYTISTVATTNTTYTYSITPSLQSGTFVAGGQTYTYTTIGDGFSGTVGTGASASNGDVHFNFQAALVAVPEPSVYGWAAAASLGGFAAARRLRRRWQLA